MSFSAEEILEVIVDSIQPRQRRRLPPMFWEAMVEHDRASARARAARLYRIDPGFRLVCIHRARLKVQAKIAARESERPPCPGCGAPVLRKRIDQAFCSGLCRQRKWRNDARAAGRRVS